jgi:hypothetical protein
MTIATKFLDSQTFSGVDNPISVYLGITSILVGISLTNIRYKIYLPGTSEVQLFRGSVNITTQDYSSNSPNGLCDFITESVINQISTYNQFGGNGNSL